MSSLELIRRIMIVSLILIIVIIPANFIIQSDLDYLEKKDALCRFYGWEAVDVRESAFSGDSFRCYKYVIHESGLGKKRIYSGTITMEKEND